MCACGWESRGVRATVAASAACRPPLADTHRARVCRRQDLIASVQRQVSNLLLHAGKEGEGTVLPLGYGKKSVLQRDGQIGEEGVLQRGQTRGRECVARGTKERPGLRTSCPRSVAMRRPLMADQIFTL